MIRIYFIDDSETTLFIYRELMKRISDAETDAGFYSSPGEALEGLKQHAQAEDGSQTVIFLDIQMPSLDGFDFLQLLEEEHEEIYQNLKVYMLTSSVMKRDREMAERFEVIRGFLEKPLMRETLIDTLEEVRENP